MKVILITGASSGIGYDMALRLAGEGHRVFAAARRTALMEPLREHGVVPLPLDVTDEESVRSCVESVLEDAGRIDVLVNNAGYGFFGPIEDVPLEEARKQMDVNVFGLISMTRAVLPQMRKQGSGRIVNISSIAGRMVILFGGWYHASKYAVEALSDALRMEVRPFGIDVVLVEPGGIKTDWGGIAAGHLTDSSKDTVYEEAAGNAARTLRRAYSMDLLSSPSVVSRAVSMAVRARRPKARYRVGFASRSAVFFHGLLPARWWDALMRLGGRSLVKFNSL